MEFCGDNNPAATLSKAKSLCLNKNISQKIAATNFTICRTKSLFDTINFQSIFYLHRKKS